MDNVLLDWENRIKSDTFCPIIKKYFPKFTDTSYDGLKDLEIFILESYKSPQEVPDDLKESIEAYISKGLIDRYKGSFVDVSQKIPDSKSMVAISYEDLDHMDVCSTLMNIPFILKTGEYWVSLFETNNAILESKKQ